MDPSGTATPPSDPPDGIEQAKAADPPSNSPTAAGQTSGERRRKRLMTGVVTAAWVALFAVVVWRAGGAAVSSPPAETTEATTPVLRIEVVTPDGQPVTDAWVEPARQAQGPSADDGPDPLLPGRQEGGDARLACDESGRLVLQAHPSAMWVGAPGKAFALVRAPARAERLRVVLEEGAEVRGEILGTSGNGIAGAVVVVTALDDDGWRRATRSRADGSFVVPGLADRAHRIDVSAPGWAATAREHLPGTTGPARLVLAPGARITGRITLAGRPVAGAAVTIAGSGVWPPRRIVSDDDGSYRIDGLPAGVYELAAEQGATVAEGREGLLLEAGERQEIDLALLPGKVLRGRITDATSGEGIEGASVTVAEDALSLLSRATRSEADGRFSVSGLRRRDHRVTVHADGYVPAPVIPHGSGDGAVAVPLQRSATIAGIVRDPAGRPVPDADLEVQGHGPNNEPIQISGRGRAFQRALRAAQDGPGATPAGELGVTLGTVPPIPLGSWSSRPGTGAPRGGERGAADDGLRTDRGGRFRLTGIPPGEVVITALAPGFSPGETAPMSIAAAQIREGVVITLAATGRIDGRVVDSAGDGVPDLRVTLADDQGDIVASTMADDDGVFAFPDCHGDLEVAAHVGAEEVAAAATHVGAGETVEVTLTVAGVSQGISGRVTDDRGFPIAGARVSVTPTDGGPARTRSGASTTDGTFTVAGLPPPPYRVEADHPDYASAIAVTVRDTTRDLHLTLGTGAAITGRLLDEWTGLPIGAIDVRLVGPGNRRLSGRTDMRGHFEILRVPAGNYDLFFESPDHIQSSVAVQLEGRAGRLYDLAIGDIRLHPAGSADGVVVDSLGAPVEGADVTARDHGERTTTDGSGQFTLTGLRPGYVTVHAAHSEAGDSEALRVRVRPGERSRGAVLHLDGRLPAQ